MKKLLILDIDNTLIYSSSKDINDKDFILTFDNTEHKYYVKKRPYLDEFLNYCNKHFRIAFWSAGESEYVKNILKNIIINIEEPVFIWSFDKCTIKRHTIFFESYAYIYKKLKKIWKNKKYNATKKDTLILDDTPSTYKYNYGNAIYIDKFDGDESDYELKRVIELLKILKDSEDVRLVEKFFY
jgi:TFIIF-interacting CTD phosphatase-like protein